MCFKLAKELMLERIIEFFVCWDSCSDLDDPVMNEISMLLSEECESMVVETTMLKSVFMSVDVVPVKPVSDHTHDIAAAARSTASKLIDNLGQASGRDVVFYQGSASDVRNKRKTTRSYLWAKDVMADPATYKPKPLDIVGMVDVDYYIDMERFLANEFKATVMYSFQPTAVCSDQGQFKFTFLKDDRVSFKVSGGGLYIHPVWNWDGDSLLIERKLFGIIPWKAATYALERRHIDAHHQIILLCPLKRYTGFKMAWLAGKYAQAQQLKRLSVVQGDFLRLQVNEKEQLVTSTGLVGGYTESRVPNRVDDAIRATKLTSTHLTLATIKSKMDDNDPSNVKMKVGAEVLLAYHKSGYDAAACSLSAASGGVRRFQWISRGEEMEYDTKPGMVQFMEPILDGGFVPDSCLGNDKRAVDKRVLKLANGTDEMSDFVTKCMDEFITLLFNDREHFLEPVDEEEVYERQNRPSQRRILDDAQHENPNRVAKNNVKKEAYPNVNDPRVISTINGPDKLAYSAFIYAVAEVVKTQHWYAFSKSPKEIAERVAEICTYADWLDLTDFSRMDGRVGKVAREFERRLMMAGFKREFHTRLFVLMKSQFCLRGVTTHGYKYETGFARASGSAETSAFNTLLTAFICFMAYRRQTDIYNAYLTPEVCWNMLGLYGGDDGVSANMNRGDAVKSASSLGQKLDIVRITRGQPGVSFLARRYGPDVWFGDSNSCCDIKRQISKFHLTVHLSSKITPQIKLAEKAYSFSLTDANTPIVGPLVKRALELFPMGKKTFNNQLNIWGVVDGSSNQYPNQYADWMQDLVDEELPGFDQALFETWILTATDVTIFKAPRFAVSVAVVVPVDGRVVVDDDIFGHDEESKEEEALPTVLAPPAQKRSQKKSTWTVVANNNKSARKSNNTNPKTRGDTSFRSRKPKDQRPSRTLPGSRK